MKTNFNVDDLPITLKASPGDQPTRLYLALRDAILSGRLPKAARLPASRNLATQLGIRRNAVVAAYERLVVEELAVSRQGAGTFVTESLPVTQTTVIPPPPPSPSVTRHNPSKTFDLGQTSVDDHILADLRKAMTRRIRRLKSDDLGYGDPLGLPELREILAQHLATTRGVVCHADQIMLVAGTQLGLHLSLRAIDVAGYQGWMEDPGYHAAKAAFASADVDIVPVPVDAQGLSVAQGMIRAPKAKLAYVTPSHQFPTGVVMPMTRRIALLDWANQTGAWIIEDDYDSEFRYSGPPLTALAGIDQAHRVIYIGTFSKTLFPGLRLGYVVAAPDIIARMSTLRNTVDRFPPVLEQGMMADLLESGAVSRHVGRMRARYKTARDAVVSELRAAGGGIWDIARPNQGLHLVARLKESLPPSTLVQIRNIAGVGGRLLSEASLEPPKQDGFVLGFSGQDPQVLVKAARRLGETARGQF